MTNDQQIKDSLMTAIAAKVAPKETVEGCLHIIVDAVLGWQFQQAQGEPNLYHCEKCGNEARVNSREPERTCNVNGCFGRAFRFERSLLVAQQAQGGGRRAEVIEALEESYAEDSSLDWMRDAAAMLRHPPAPVAVPDMKWLKEVCTSFFYWWHNQPGANTRQGFDSWLKTEAAQKLLAAPAPAEPTEESKA